MWGTQTQSIESEQCFLHKREQAYLLLRLM